MDTRESLCSMSQAIPRLKGTDMNGRRSCHLMFVLVLVHAYDFAYDNADTGGNIHIAQYWY